MKIAITQGDTNGVGLEVILKVFEDPTMCELCTPIIYGSPKVAAYYRKALDLTTNWVTITTPEEAQEGKLNLLVTTDEEVKIDLGQATPESGAAALQALERAVADAKERLVDALVTAPVCKSAIKRDDFHFTGHTEYLAEKLAPTSTVPDSSAPATIPDGSAPATVPDGSAVGQSIEPLMILMDDTLRVALVTTHMPLREVAHAVTEESIIGKLAIFDHSLRQDFLITHPRIAVLSLNPHAGDDGLLGKEEQETISPAIDKANEQGMHVYGPFAADGFFGTRAWEHYDGVLAMYHDQGLAAFKALAMENGVNYTAGLPIVRTSPDHGTAYDIAGRGEADPTSLRQAIYQAIDIVRAREAWEDAHINPLPKLYKERREDDRPNHFNAEGGNQRRERNANRGTSVRPDTQPRT